LAFAWRVETMPPFLMAARASSSRARFCLRFSASEAQRGRRAVNGAPTRSSGTFLSLGGTAPSCGPSNVSRRASPRCSSASARFSVVLTAVAAPGGTPARHDQIRRALARLRWRHVAAAPWQNAAHAALNLAGVTAIPSVALPGASVDLLRHAKHGADPFLASSLQMLGGGAALTLAELVHGDFGNFTSTHRGRARGSPRLPRRDRIARRISTFVWLNETQHAGARVDLRLR